MCDICVMNERKEREKWVSDWTSYIPNGVVKELPTKTRYERAVSITIETKETRGSEDEE